MICFHCRPAFIALALVVFSTPVRADKLTKADLGRLGKAATALVELPGRGTGTAFCIHPSGLFVTNEHVVRGGEKVEIKVIVDASLKTQRVFPATIVRVDKELDLALLRVASKVELPRLFLGSNQDITELMPVVAFGFPLGAALAVNRKEYPAVSVNAGHVSALRRKDGDLHRIQIDSSVTIGNSGGPVLDESGKIVGAVQSGVAGSRGINFLIPVGHVARFLNAPDIQFTPPELTRTQLDRLLEFKAGVVSFVPGAKTPSLRLILQAGDQKPREFPMTAKGGAFIASAVPVGKVKEARVEISVRVGAGMVVGQTGDLLLKVGARALRLSSVRRIEMKTKQVVLVDGKTLEGVITGLGPVEVAVGDERIMLDLRKANQIQVQPAPELVVVMATVIATVDGKEVGRIESAVPIRDVGQSVQVNPSSVPITAPPLTDDRVIKRLPEAFSDVCLGGGGRYFVFHLPRLHKLAIFDVSEARITGYIPVTEDKVVFGAGLEKVVIGLPMKGVLERWNLATAERELTVFPPFPEQFKLILMGHASTSSLVVNGRFLDLGTLRPLPIRSAEGKEQVWESGDRRYPSGDGTVFGAWNTRYSPGTATTFVLEGNVVKRYDEASMGHVIPGPDGRMVFTGKGVTSATLKWSDPDDAKLGYCLPAVRGNYFFSLSTAGETDKGRLTVYLFGHPRPVAKLDSVGHGLRFDSWDRDEFGVWRRIFFIPQANLIVVLPTSNDQLVLHKFNVETALEQSGVDYLLVASQPPRTAKAGSTLNYALAIKAKHAPATFKLESGPKGMEVSKDGVVTWPAPADHGESNQEVILTVRDARGQEIFHTFTVRVVR